MTHPQQISDLSSSFASLSLDEMDKVSFMDRIDTKYLFPVHMLPGILSKMNGDYLILKTNGTSIPSYKTLYFDTPDYFFFRQHVRNVPFRSKLRLRLYESTGDSFLEVKKKNGRNRTKKWRIENKYSATLDFDRNALEFIAKHVEPTSELLKPVLGNSFNRLTFIGKKFNERVTIDLNLQFYDNPGKSVSLPFLAIAEVKRDRSGINSGMAGILREISARPTGFSKYCVGSVLLQSREHANILKSKLLLIKKIENEYNKCFAS